ncbi:MAG: hypothetical protein IPP69_10400 [Flavobacteriales bacterium]|nr:hypothetical protein [Flavobacteriales bacterium]
MMKSKFYPLRTIVGSSIPIRAIFSVNKDEPPFKVEIRKHLSLQDTVVDDVYSNFLPDIIKGGITYHPAPGMNTMPMSVSNLLPFDDIVSLPYLDFFKNPSDIPFPETDKVSSIYGYQEGNFIELELNSQQQDGNEMKNHLYSGRDKTYSFLIALEHEALVGGMCFNGYPYISSRLENTLEGMTVGNFGLPREIRLTPLPSSNIKSIEELTGYQRSQFIDSEFAYTRQEILSHSGLNYLTVDPVKTNLFLLTITDLPFIPRTIDLDARKFYMGNGENPLLVKGFKGFAIPYLWFFEYKEQTKCTARLHAGILGVKPSYPHLPRMEWDNAFEDVLRRAFPEWEYYFLEGEEMESIEVKKIKAELSLLEEQLHRNPSRRAIILEEAEKLVKKLRKLKRDLGLDKPNEPTEGIYWAYTAHSALGQRREFQFSYAQLNYTEKIKALPILKEKKFLSECFVSDLLMPNEKTTLYLQQSEEFERCIAGMKALFLLIPDDENTERIAERIANLRGIGVANGLLTLKERTFVEDALAFYLTLPPETNFCEQFRLKIYEIDPLDGVSPAQVDLNSKYATLLADVMVDDFLDVLFSQLLKGIPFRKTSTSKYFALEFTNTGTKAGQVAIHSMQLVRSAHVSVQPRPARTQQVKAMHYRLIGSELADDYSKLGNEGFNFSIDRVTAGQTKNVLYSAMSLLDLLHTGGARIQSNMRRRAAEFEMVENYRDNENENVYLVKKFPNDNLSGPNFDDRFNRGWRRSETGKDVQWNSSDNNPRDLLGSTNNSKFENYSSNENRVHSAMLFPDTNNSDWAAVSMLGNLLKALTDPLLSFTEVLEHFRRNGTIEGLRDILDGIDPKILIESYRASGVANDQLLVGFEEYWKGIDTTLNRLRVTGVVTASQSPSGLSNFAGNDLFDFVNTVDQLPAIVTGIQDAINAGNPLGLVDLIPKLSGIIDPLLQAIGVGVLHGGAIAPILMNGMSIGLTTGVGVNIGTGLVQFFQHIK